MSIGMGRATPPRTLISSYPFALVREGARHATISLVGKREPPSGIFIGGCSISEAATAITYRV